MKNRMPTRESLGKISSYLRMFGFNHGGQTDARQAFRQETGLQNTTPNSTKVGSRGSVFQIPIRSFKQIRKMQSR